MSLVPVLVCAFVRQSALDEWKEVPDNCVFTIIMSCLQSTDKVSLSAATLKWKTTRTQPTCIPIIPQLLYLWLSGVFQCLILSQPTTAFGASPNFQDYHMNEHLIYERSHFKLAIRLAASARQYLWHHLSVRSSMLIGAQFNSRQQYLVVMLSTYIYGLLTLCTVIDSVSFANSKASVSREISSVASLLVVSICFAVEDWTLIYLWVTSPNCSIPSRLIPIPLLTLDTGNLNSGLSSDKRTWLRGTTAVLPGQTS